MFEKKNYLSILLGLLILFGFYLTTLHSYLLFHSLAELFSIVVACGIFIVAFNARGFLDNHYFLFLGIAYLFVAALDLLHTLAYTGMGVFPGYGTNLATQLWIASRYAESIPLLIAPLFVGRKLRIDFVFVAFAAFFALVLGSIFSWHIFPDCFVEGVGLTPFKKISEYVICLILIASIGMLVSKRKAFDAQVIQMLVASLVVTVCSELSFTFYVHAYGFPNLTGHFFKIISFYLIYKAIVQMGLFEPYKLLFRNLKQSEDRLRRAHEELERRVEERTADLVSVNEKLLREIEERKLAEEALLQSENKYRLLLESLPQKIFYKDRNSIYVSCNENYARDLKITPHEIRGNADFAFFPKERAEKYIDDDKRIIASGNTEDIEEKYFQDGEETWVHTVKTPVKDEKGNITGVLGIFWDITEQKRTREALERSEANLRRLSLQLIEIQETERKRIAMELHDSIVQFLAAIKFALEDAVTKMPASVAKESVDSLKALIPLIQQTSDEVRRIHTDLRPGLLDDLGIVATISWFCREFERLHSNLRIEKRIDIEEKEIPDPLKIVIFRVLQEALNNISKHAKAYLVRLSMKAAPNKIELLIEDNGQGFDISQARSGKSLNRGFGLTNMKERTVLSGGAFSIQSVKGTGTTVRASWPCSGIR